METTDHNTSSPGLPPRALIDITTSPGAVEQFVQLTLLGRKLESRDDASGADRQEVRRLRAELLPEARREAQRLQTFFETYRDELDALAARAQADGRSLSSRPAGDFGRRGVERAEALVRWLADDSGNDDHDDLCAAYDALIFEEDVRCIEGSELACATAAQWAHLAAEDGCL